MPRQVTMGPSTRAGRPSSAVTCYIFAHPPSRGQRINSYALSYRFDKRQSIHLSSMVWIRLHCSATRNHGSN